MSDEELIEKTARVIADLHASSYVDEYDRVYARAALAVFREHTDSCIVPEGIEPEGPKGCIPGVAAFKAAFEAWFRRGAPAEPAVTDSYEAGYAEGFRHGRGTPKWRRVTDEMLKRALDSFIRTYFVSTNMDHETQMRKSMRTALEAALSQDGSRDE